MCTYRQSVKNDYGRFLQCVILMVMILLSTNEAIVLKISLHLCIHQLKIQLDVAFVNIETYELCLCLCVSV